VIPIPSPFCKRKLVWPLDENRVADGQRLGRLSLDGPVIARFGNHVGWCVTEWPSFNP
jgi:hypothetical protein